MTGDIFLLLRKNVSEGLWNEGYDAGIVVNSFALCYNGKKPRKSPKNQEIRGEFMRTEQCYCVVEAVKTGSFTKAAENLFLKQPSLRANINHLEDELGQPLFERSKSGVKLTEFGEFCYPYILNVIKSYESMKNSCAKKNEKSLLIGATRVFSSLLGKSYELYENYSQGAKCIFFSSTSDQDILQRVVEHKLDIGLISYFPALWKENKWFHMQQGRSFEIYKIREIQTIAVMRRDHPLAYYKEIPLEKLKDYLLAFFSDDVSQVLDLIKQETKTNGVLRITKVMDEQLLRKYLLQENAISFSLDWTAERYNGDLISVPLDERFIQHAVALYSTELFPEDVMGYLNIIKTLLTNTPIY